VKTPTSYTLQTANDRFLRLSVDIDVAGNPLGFHATAYREGREEGVVILGFPGPFDSQMGAFVLLQQHVEAHVGTQGLLW
jgi:hypothetical protein